MVSDNTIGRHGPGIVVGDAVGLSSAKAVTVLSAAILTPSLASRGAAEEPRSRTAAKFRNETSLNIVQKHY